MRRWSSTNLLQCLLVFLALWTVTMSEQCSWTTHPNTYADGGTSSNVKDVEACRNQCVSKPACVAVLFDPDDLNNCMEFTSEPQNVVTDGANYASKTLYRRSCVPDATSTSAATTATTATATDATSTSAATTATTATATGSCAMAEQSNSKVTAQPAVTASASVESCKQLCAALQQCLAISYGASTCTIHTAAVSSPANTAGYVFARRTTCPSGASCCFTAEEAGKKGSHSSDKSLQVTEASCKDMCAQVETCTAVSFTGGNTCNFFTGQPSSSSQTGSAYFKKDCQGSASPGTLVLELGCNSSETIRLSKLLGVWLVCLVIAWF